ncbi:HNH endonuclease [Cryobacterium sp. TMB3-1-2]|uniref:HNH endonuclease n=1 Tax=Cryobacterium sp. TMB3-1-2 TaxID=1259208 RepID=UPI002103C2F8|nr:HNH endonuclease [Cryobacterium sp. TMB3-1-2]
MPDPEFTTTFVSRRIRDSQLARDVKKLYDYQCQVCEHAVPTSSNVFYAEGAHVRPLGRPHFGHDALSNILCLCPNHHTQFDLGGLVLTDEMEAIETRTLTPIASLSFRKLHIVALSNVSYHRALWLGERGLSSDLRLLQPSA